MRCRAAYEGMKIVVIDRSSRVECVMSSRGWCGSFPSPHSANQTAYVTAFIATDLHKVKIGAVGCAEWCEAHQLVSDLKNHVQAIPIIVNCTENSMQRVQLTDIELLVRPNRKLVAGGVGEVKSSPPGKAKDRLGYLAAGRPNILFGVLKGIAIKDHQRAAVCNG